MTYEQLTLFKVLDRKYCGPHCIAKDNGHGHMIIGHCDRCHEEFDFPIDERPRH